MECPPLKQATWNKQFFLADPNGDILIMTTDRVFNVKALDSPDALAISISDKWVRWKNAKAKAEDEAKELQNYIFATDTRTTSNNKLGWKNSTTVPKLTQIRENLHANYMASLFPNRDWLQWIGEGREEDTKQKKRATTSFMRKKLLDSKFEDTISKLIQDWIDYGNCFAGVSYVSKEGITPNGERSIGYDGPILYRISPLDIVFDPTAETFEGSPKITRTVKSLGDFIADVEQDSENKVWKQELVDNMINDRRSLQNGLATKSFNKRQLEKNARFQYDGYGSIVDYYNGDAVEVLEFEGTLYDMDSGELYRDHKIIVVDRAYVAYMAPFASLDLKPTKLHSSWRKRPDNLWGMGPLDNLVGMQYRIDHLENLKADVMDMIAHPIIMIKGEVSWNGYGPGAEAYLDDNAEMKFESPQAQALSADFQIDTLERRMEELAGAPKEAMGIRSPGEKTKFEVSQLQNAASRLFTTKLKQFEKEVLEPAVNMMLEHAIRFMGPAESTISVRAEDDTIGAEIVQEISVKDIETKGRLQPIGARHFARQAQLAQDLLTVQNFKSDPSIAVHLSGKKQAEMIEELLQFEKFQLYGPNVLVTEQVETERAKMVAQEQLELEQQEPTELTPEDVEEEIAGSVPQADAGEEVLWRRNT